MRAGHGPAVREIQELSRVAHTEDRIGAVLSGAAEPNPHEYTTGNEISTGNFINAVQGLRDQNVEPVVIEAFLREEPLPPETHFKLRQLQARLHGDKDWVKKFLAGDVEARETQTKITMGLMRPAAAI